LRLTGKGRPGSSPAILGHQNSSGRFREALQI
jgi:hypothetical protein